ncbi:MAG: serine/threonine-protein kinase, partial [Candidatus Brocadiia bacterium]|nr:serine/threonine-protein kinase [Candidatus Brocadiia bacterium]
MAKGIPSRFGQCEVKEKLGEGAMATVYLGEHAGLQIPVAIKVPRFLPNGDLLEDEQYSSRFMREAQLAARLHHPNIVRVYDAGEQDGCYFMVLQYVDGPTVKDKLDEWECFLWHEAVPIILAICEGLQYAVDKGVIHRDIKPDNIMIDSNGVPLLMDLGLAKGDAALGAHLTQSSDVLGTPFYMSPE